MKRFSLCLLSFCFSQALYASGEPAQQFPNVRAELSCIGQVFGRPAHALKITAHPGRLVIDKKSVDANVTTRIEIASSLPLVTDKVRSNGEIKSATFLSLYDAASGFSLLLVPTTGSNETMRASEKGIQTFRSLQGPITFSDAESDSLGLTCLGYIQVL